MLNLELNKLMIRLSDLLFTGAISNNHKFIIYGGPDNLKKIWKFKTNVRMKSIKFSHSVTSCKFTDDSQLLYVGTYKRLH